MTQAIEHWTAADQQIAELNDAAKKLHDGIASGHDQPEVVRALLAKLDTINNAIGRCLCD